MRNLIAIGMTVFTLQGLPVCLGQAPGQSSKTDQPTNKTKSKVAKSSKPIEVKIDDGGYEGKWTISGKGKTNSGILKLKPGMHVVRIARNVKFSIIVNGGGTVISKKPDAAEGGKNSLTFKTDTVKVIRNKYDGQFITIGRGPKLIDEDKNKKALKVVLVKGLKKYELVLAYGARFPFDVDAQGNVSTESKAADVAETEPKTLSLNTGTVKVKRNDYLGEWIGIARGPKLSRNGEIVLVKGIKAYLLKVAYGARFPFDVDAQGNVSTESKAADVAETEPKTLSLNTGTLKVKRNGYLGEQIGISHGPKLSKNGEIVLVKGIKAYLLKVASGAHFSFDVDANGNVGGCRNSAATKDNELTFRVIKMKIKFEGDYTTLKIPGLIEKAIKGSGESNVVNVVRGVNYTIKAWGKDGEGKDPFIEISP